MNCKNLPLQIRDEFLDSDSAPASDFETPAQTPQNFKTSTPTPVNTPKAS